MNNDYNHIRQPWMIELDAVIAEIEHAARDRIIDLLEEDLREGRLSRPYPDSLVYGVDPEIDRLIDDLWTAHDDKLFRGGKR